MTNENKDILFPNQEVIVYSAVFPPLFLSVNAGKGLGTQTQSKIHKYLIKVRYFCALAGQAWEQMARGVLQRITCEVVSLACIL